MRVPKFLKKGFSKHKHAGRPVRTDGIIVSKDRRWWCAVHPAPVHAPRRDEMHAAAARRGVNRDNNLQLLAIELETKVHMKFLLVNSSL